MLQEVNVKKFILLIVILISYPVYSACPIEADNTACIAEFQNTSIPALPSSDSKLMTPNTAVKFSGTPDITDSSREISPKKSLRNFSANNQDYGYNASCQFGACPESGTPKIFSQEKND